MTGGYMLQVYFRVRAIKSLHYLNMYANIQSVASKNATDDAKNRGDAEKINKRGSSI